MLRHWYLPRYRLKPGHKRAPSFSEFCHFLVLFLLHCKLMAGFQILEVGKLGIRNCQFCTCCQSIFAPHNPGDILSWYQIASGLSDSCIKYCTGKWSATALAIREGVKTGKQCTLETYHNKLQPLSAKVNPRNIGVKWKDGQIDPVCCHRVKQVFNGNAPGHPGQRHGLLEPEAQPQHWPWLYPEGGGWGSHISKQVKTLKSMFCLFRTLQAFTGVHPKTIRKLYQLYRLDFELFGFSAEEYLALNKSWLILCYPKQKRQNYE